MAASSLLALLDDITSILDDVSVLTKVAARKTAGVLGDDLALNAQQVTGVRAERELPVVWAVAKGSLINKAILVPAALLISAIAPWAVTPLLMLGGAFLCFEGAEKVLHRLLHDKHEDQAHEKRLLEALTNEQVDLRTIEKDKIRGAIRTDFILSAEIIVIALGTVSGEDFLTRVTVMIAIALAMTVGVYGLVAGIVKLDDLGLYLHKRASSAAQAIGRGILRAAPWLMKALSVGGTIAMFLVGGSILEHGVPALHHSFEEATHDAGPWRIPLGMLFNLAVGAIAGGVLVGVYALVRRARGKPALPA